MTKYVALKSIRHGGSGQKQTASPQVEGGHHGVFEADFSEAEFARLSEAGAIRLATKKDISALEDDELDLINVTPPKPEPKLEALKQGDKWVVARDGATVSGETLFDSKKDADAWAKANPDAGAEPNLLS